MERDHVAHLAGVFDVGGSITAHITKGSASIGYRFEPLLRLHRPMDEEFLIGKLHAYCEDYGVKYKEAVTERDSGDVYVFEVTDAQSIERFLDPMMDYLTVHYERATIMLEEVLPMVRKKEHLNKDGFYELVGYADILREGSRYGPEPKYTQEFFRDEWEDVPA